jgi:predicted transcriptional regulator
MVSRRKPTEAELQILNVLWERGPSTVREVASVLGREDSYTTVLKLLQLMAGKRLVDRDETTRSHVYKAAVSQQATQRRLVSDLIRNAFSGSATRLVMQAIDNVDTSPEELAEIEKVIKRHRGGRQ